MLKSYVISYFLAFSVFLVTSKTVFAANVYGGKVSLFLTCICTKDLLVKIGPPKGGSFKYKPGTQKYLNFNLPLPGTWALGLYDPSPGTCRVPDPKSGCSPGIIIGTSEGEIKPTTGTSLRPG